MTAIAVDDRLGDGLSRVAQALAVPVLIAAVLVLLLTALEFGRYAAETFRRNRAARRGQRLTALARTVVQHPDRAAILALSAPSELSAEALRRIGAALLAGDPDGVEHALADYEHLVQRRLDRTRVLVRAGPAVGLMGTLIPLAPGLKALGDGRVELLADDLRVAFAATVVGLLAGTIAFALTLARTRRASEDLDALERATAQLRATAAAAAHARAQAAGEAIVAREQAQVPA